MSQALFDAMFADMDRNLREMGAGDLGIGRRVRAMAEGLYGRIAAYDEGLAGDDAVLAAALRRNVFGTMADPGPPVRALSALCGYLQTAGTLLAGQDTATLMGGQVGFPEPPGHIGA
jgi:cytochrome b pre-mRNA-processing protein 3